MRAARSFASASTVARGREHRHAHARVQRVAAGVIVVEVRVDHEHERPLRDDGALRSRIAAASMRVPVSTSTQPESVRHATTFAVPADSTQTRVAERRHLHERGCARAGPRSRRSVSRGDGVAAAPASTPVRARARQRERGARAQAGPQWRSWRNE